MAKILSQAGIETSNAVEAWHVTQSIDAFTGTEAYDITISGSLNMTGPINGQSGLINLLTASYAISSSRAISSSFAISSSYSISSSYALNSLTASYSLNGGGGNATGSNYEIQFNRNGDFGATSSFIYDYDIQSLEQGSSVTASGAYSHAEGYLTKALTSWSHAEGYNTHASASAAHAEGYETSASGWYSHAEGYKTKTKEGSEGSYSHAEGYLTLTSGVASHAEGRLTTASGDYSHAEGSSSLASGIGSHAEGAGTWASASFSHAGGINTTSYGPAQTVVGVFNVTQSYAFDDLFVVGNGLLTRSNAFRVDLGGTTYTSTGTVSSGADYAEYFESHDGTAIPKGTVVELTGSFIKPCEIADNAIGVISSTPTIVGNSDDGTSDEWVGKYEKDKWGIPIREEIESEFIPGENILVNAKKISPNFDPSLPYIPRSERPEWNIVGIMGQILVLKDQPIPSRWIKMKDIDDEIALYFVR